MLIKIKPKGILYDVMNIMSELLNMTVNYKQTDIISTEEWGRGRSEWRGGLWSHLIYILLS